jgi:hypothetical protein
VLPTRVAADVAGGVASVFVDGRRKVCPFGGKPSPGDPPADAFGALRDSLDPTWLVVHRHNRRITAGTFRRRAASVLSGKVARRRLGIIDAVVRRGLIPARCRLPKLAAGICSGAQ